MVRYKNVLAVFAILGIVSGFALTSWVTMKEMDVATPTALKVLQDKRLMVATVKDVLIADHKGNLIDSVPITALGIVNERVVDIDETISGEILLATTGDNIVYKCSSDLSSCVTFMQPTINPFDPNAATVLIATDLDSKTIYLANSSNQQIEQYDMAGKFIKNLLLDSQGLLYPNDMWILDDGRVAVADTLHNRIVTLDPTREKNIESFFTRGHPVSIAMTPEKTWWAVEWQNLPTQTTIEQYDKAGVHLGQASLQLLDDPIMLGIDDTQGLLALMQETARIGLFDMSDGFSLGSLEGRGFDEYFDRVRSEKAILNGYLQLAYIILGLSALLVIFVIVLEYGGKRQGTRG